MIGWVKLHRKLLDHWCAQEPLFLAVWTRLLMEANYEDKKRMINGSPIVVKRGQVIYGREAFSQRSGVPVAKLRRVISILEGEGMISQQKKNKYSIISITNYTDHQGDDQQSASKTPARNQQTATPKEVKENKEDKPAAKATSSPVGIKKFIDDRKAEGEMPISPNDPIFKYAADAGIPDAFLTICWIEFVERNTASNKRQKDWKAAFRNCVRSNWYKLWWLDGDCYCLTTTGKQAEIKHRNTGRAA
ncbi:phage replisome organizer N-terminal domain-containing protein [Zhongshania sp.]|uniref:phage replisome organizer N-terminal domain-containing protein n=1 Tax=Zhongshania sp. TaxID=1971902 RepID=UPI001B524F1E|nr:phage replisome organizer N-terminal domain-containing protein [Zhongshania sp.]MBQ0797558.1 phage replisome organizer N-terminal domain-containing protein [Zhongshania sp.]